MSITLNPEQETIIANLIATGGFQTADEVLQVALKLLEQERHSYQLWLTETREQVKEGIESLDRGEGVDGAHLAVVGGVNLPRRNMGK
jgi:antitoxin ParD1/3/4